MSSKPLSLAHSLVLADQQKAAARYTTREVGLSPVVSAASSSSSSLSSRVDMKTILPNLTVGTVAGNGEESDTLPILPHVLSRPNDICYVDKWNACIITEDFTSVLRRWDVASNTLTLFAGRISSDSGCVDGPTEKATFNRPKGLCYDRSFDCIYVCDWFGHKIRRIKDGVVSTVAGDGAVGWKDGDGKTARFNYPAAVTVNSAGTMFVVDQDNDRIRQITRNNNDDSYNVTTLAGNGQRIRTVACNNARNATFCLPFTVVVNPIDENILFIGSDGGIFRLYLNSGIVTGIHTVISIGLIAR